MMRLYAMAWKAPILPAILLFVVTTCNGTETNLVARWDFDEGGGDVLHDSSGHDNHGAIRGARWVTSGKGHALWFDGVDDHVDCGNRPSLDLSGPLSLEAWVHPDAPTTGEPGIVGKFYNSYLITYYKDGASYFYIGGPGDNGIPASVKLGQWSHLAAVFDQPRLQLFVNGREISSSPSKYPKPQPGKNFMIGGKIGDTGNIDEALRSAGFFAGMIDAVRVYNRALTSWEIVAHFNKEAPAKGLAVVDPALFGKLWTRHFLYEERGRVVLDVDYHWVTPLPPDAALRAELLRRGESTVLQTTTIKPDSPRDRVEASFSIDGLADGEYVLRASLLDHQAESAFTLPGPELLLPSPRSRKVPPLPATVTPPKYGFKLSANGGFVVSVKGKSYPVESSFSYPHGGENALTVGTIEGGEPDWTVKTRRLDDRAYHVRAEGRHYAIDRQITLRPARIEVRDTITNKTDAVLGIIFQHHLNVRGLADARRTLLPNPTVFVARSDSGLGLVPLDDVYFLQQRTVNLPDRVAILDEHFGLDKRASYTVQWAAYPTATGDYYDFINQLRKDAGLNRRVEGALALTMSWDPPPKRTVDLMEIKYVSLGNLTRILDPTISLEGWEFMEYPEICQKLKRSMAATRAAYPDMKVMFHVAHSLYATDKPEQLFPDSRAIEENGSQTLYGSNTTDYYGKYFARELLEKNWRWWIFYPTMENRFGSYMLRAADCMIHELGATAIWADGYIGGYVRGKYTYDRWDGHSVTIDPKTKTVVRQKSNVTLVSLPVLKAVARKFSDNGGVLLINDLGGPPSFWEENVITSNETGGGDQQPIASLHLGQTVTPLGNPMAIKVERDIYLDILSKLDHGALYFPYGDRDLLTEPTILSHMYPITFDSLHAGTVRGKERIVTMNSGVYGWQGDRDLHHVYRYDARGRLVRNPFFTTVDAASVRTELALGEQESAVVRKIPITLKATRAVNVRSERYDSQEIALTLNGAGKVRIEIRDGEFPIPAGAEFQLQTDSVELVRADKHGTLSLPLALDGLQELRLKPATARAERE